MRNRFNFLFLSAFLLCCGAQSAQAQSLYAGVLGGYASTTSDNPYDVEPYGVGLGVSAGLSLPVFPLYLGARALWYFGDESQISNGGTSLALDSHYMLYGIDIGYDAELGPLVLRPALGIGRAVLENSGSAVGSGGSASISATDGSLYIAPSIGLVVKLGLLYVGGELRYNGLTEDEQFDSMSLLASLGLTI